MSVLRPACPIAYHYRPENLAGPPVFRCTTLYAAGGMYGNPYALDAIWARAGAEPNPPEIVFNGDFHYLDTDPAVFRAINDRVRACHATQGNIEYALTTADDTLGCGCDYPGYVPDAVVADSNAVVAELRTATAAAEDYRWLAGLPRYLTAAVGEHRVGIVHGDPENLAGWRLALEAVEPQQLHIRDRTGFAGTPTTARQVLDWFRRSDVEALSCTHTGLPYAQDFPPPRAGTWSRTTGALACPASGAATTACSPGSRRSPTFPATASTGWRTRACASTLCPSNTTTAAGSLTSSTPGHPDHRPTATTSTGSNTAPGSPPSTPPGAPPPAPVPGGRIRISDVTAEDHMSVAPGLLMT